MRNRNNNARKGAGNSGGGYQGKRERPQTESRFSKPSIKKSSLRFTDNAAPKGDTTRPKFGNQDFDRPRFGDNRRPSRDGDQQSDFRRDDFRNDGFKKDFKKPYPNTGGERRFERNDRESGFDRNDRGPRSFDKPRFDKPGFGKPGFDKPRFERNERGGDFNERRGFDKPRFDREDRGPRNFDKPGYDKPGYDKPRFDRNERNDRGPRSFDKPGFDKPGFAKPGFDREDRGERSFDKPRFDRNERSDRAPRSFDRNDRGPRSFEKPFNRDENRGTERGGDRFERRDRHTGFEGRPSHGGDDRRAFRDDRFQDKKKDSEQSEYAEKVADAANRRVGKYEYAPQYNLEGYEKKTGKTAKTEQNEMRLNKYISNAGICSRREADDLIATGQISVNGKIVTEMGYKVMPSDVVRYGKKSLNPEKLVYILINKPKDYITTTEDPEDRKTVLDLIEGACSERVYPVGRLDRNTTGLLLMTNDGELAVKLTHPSTGIKKIYQAELDKPITTEDFELLQAGVQLEDGFIRPDEVGLVTPDAMVVGLEIHSGRNRIVRRMFEHLGYEVQKLDRTVFAGLNKKDLPRGKWRFLSEKEVIKLKYLL